MLSELQELQSKGKPIRVALLGAGAMGVGIAMQIKRTPGMELAFIGDIKLDAAKNAAKAANLRAKVVKAPSDFSTKVSEDEVIVGEDCLELLSSADLLPYDVLVESSNTIAAAYDYCECAIENGKHVVLMNAEVDLVLGRRLQRKAEAKGVVVTSDAGDQHGVLVRLIEEAKSYDFEVVQAGNIKGFLNRYATAKSLEHEAAKRNLDPVQCCAYTDGTKLCIEMALLANATGMGVSQPGMLGPKCKHVDETPALFDLDSYPKGGCVDYVLGAEPGGGVYIICKEENKRQREYLEYYKLGKGKYYVLYRHYHLCHLETPFAIYEAVVKGRAILNQSQGSVADVFAYAKRDIKAGESVEHAIGGDLLYGLIENSSSAKAAQKVPIGILEKTKSGAAIFKQDVKKDSPLTFAKIKMPDSKIYREYLAQEAEELDRL